MSQFIDDENVEEFRGGTLQLNNSNRDQIFTIENSPPASAVHSSRVVRTTQQLSSTEPAVLSGADVISPVTSTSSISEANAARKKHMLPMYHIPFAFENAKDYFSYRNGLVESAIDECNSTLIFPNQDGQVIGSWLLTEISIWDNEKERLVTLTDKALITVKYDFIALRQLEFRKVYLEDLDTVALGDLIYPPASLVPRLNGLANGVSSVVRDCILDRFTSSTAPATDFKKQSESESDRKFGPIDLKTFESRNRNMRGVRALWNRGQPLSFIKKWNPFDKEIPLNTFTSHPLYWHKDTPEGSAKDLYDSEHFAQKLITAVEAINEGRESPCKIHHAPIILPNYIGLTSLLHNKNSLGFFKVRGKFSF